MLLKSPFLSVFGVKDQNEDNIDTSELTFKYSENIVIFNFHIICRNLFESQNGSFPTKTVVSVSCVV